ncbi:hypothetical protein IE077_003637 [Cardiosporidium cionae]|uniref:Uncharacterized protein n=1 Tax=Cardiosporidium cionae TaxID=476202 RepID=A0ABQ7J7V3_9APIC|nr:hypothetical protein IE077_003637 [Cardiosporidium cionae]|eukprot:KAF8820054.1 hypothetical protein IE077_003637 [Cardiosporidium cionae]
MRITEFAATTHVDALSSSPVELPAVHHEEVLSSSTALHVEANGFDVISDTMNINGMTNNCLMKQADAIISLSFDESQIVAPELHPDGVVYPSRAGTALTEEEKSVSDGPASVLHDQHFQRDNMTRITRSFHDGSTKFIPKKHWLILPIYVLLIFTSGCIYWGWSGGFREILLKMNAYKELKNQEYHIGNLLTVATSFSLIFSFVSGIILDFWGPRNTAILGLTARFIGFLLFAASNQSLSLYVPALALIGGSTDLLYLPIASSVCLFRKHRGTVLSIFGAAMSASSAIPVIAFQSWHHFFNQWSSLLYFGMISTVWFIITLLAVIFYLPMKSFSFLDGSNTLEQKQKFTSAAIANAPLDDQINYATVVKSLSHDCAVEHTVVPIPCQSPSTEVAMPIFCSQAFFNSLKIWLQPFGRLSYILILPLSAILVYRSKYIQTVAYQEMEHVYYLWVLLEPLRFIPCIFLGFLSDRISHLKMMGIFEITSLLLFSTLLFDSEAFQYATLFLTYVYTSWVMTSLYIFISNSQPPEHFGKLAGFLSFFAGMFLFLAIPIANASEKHPDGQMILNYCLVDIARSGLQSLLSINS